MKRLFRRIVIGCFATALLALTASSQQVLLKDNFGSDKLGRMWKQTYPEEPQMRVLNGALEAKWGTVWYIQPKKFSIRDHPAGLRLTADMKFYPQTGYEWKPSSHFHPFGFQNNKGGVGTVYARFSVDDSDRDGTVDSIRFVSKNGGQRYIHLVKGYNPRTDREFHRFRIDWFPDRVEGYLDGRLVAVHVHALAEPLWVVGRNEHGGTILDNFSVMALGSALKSASYTDPVRIESEALGVPPGGRIVADPDASGGKSVELHGEKKKSGADRIHANFPKAESAGRYALKVRLSADGLYDLARGWRVQVEAGGDMVGWDVFHGYQFKGAKGYRDLVVPFELPQGGLEPVVSMFWVEEDASKPVVRVDSMEVVRLGDLPSLQITKVWPDKIRYLENEDGTVTVTCRNATAADLQGKVKLELVYALDAPRQIGEQAVSLASGASTKIRFPMHHGGGTFGYEARATALVNGKAVHTASEYFCVTNNPNEVATHHGRFSRWELDPRIRGKHTPSAESILGAMVQGRWDQLKHEINWNIRYWLDLDPSDGDLAECALQAREAYVTWFEVYSWCPGGCIDMDPKAEIWNCGDDGRWLYSKRQIKGNVASLKKHGIGVCTYILPYTQGIEGLDLMRERPEWFCNFAQGVAGVKKVREFRKRMEAAPESQWPRLQQEALGMGNGLYLKLNFTRRDVLDYVIDRVTDSIRTYDWDGIRWDVGNLETGPIYGVWKPFLDFYGKPLARTPQKMVAQTVENVKYFRARLRKERPNFYFGLNWGGGWPLDYPKLTAAFMNGGGWLLDEETRRWSRPDCAYRTWDKFYEYMSDRGELMTSNGGHYNPYGLHIVIPGSFGAAHLYSMIFGIAGHGHPEFHTRSKVFPIGDATQFAVRFGRYLFDNTFRRVDKPERFVNVAAPRPVWWRKSVLRKQAGGKDTWVIHLINPPLEKAIEDNLKSNLPEPMRNVAVSLNLPPGRTRVQAWALMSESWRFGDRPVTQAVPLEVRRARGKATVTIPELLFWKVLVFEFN